MFIPSIKRGSKLQLFGMTVICLLLAAGPAYAQIGTGTMLGNLTDPSGALVPGAKVTATNVDTAYARSGTSDAQGSYRFPAMPVGNYKVQASKEGFKTAEVKGLTLAVGQEAVLNIVLTVGSRQETVEVSTQAQQVDTTNSSIGFLVGEQKLSDLPLNGRNFTDFTLLLAGISEDQAIQTFNPGFQGTSYSSNGAPLRSNSVLIDGASMRTMQGMNASSATGTSLGMDGVQEYNVLTSMFGAEYGGGMGSQTNIVSKGGTNDWHGDAFEYFRNSALDARNYYDLLYTLPKDVGGRGIAEFQRNQFGGSIGGPIQKNKTFFFVTYEGVRQNVGNPLYLGTVTTMGANCFNSTTKQILATGNPCAQSFAPPTINPTGTVVPYMLPIANLWPYPNLPNSQYIWPSLETDVESYGQARLDHTFSTKDSAFARYTVDNATYQRPETLPYDRYIWPSRNQFLTLAENHVFSSSLLNTFHASLSRTAMGGTVVASPAVQAPAITTLIPGAILGLIIPAPVTDLGPPPSIVSELNQDIVSFSDDLYWTKGKHALKFGALMSRYEDAIGLVQEPGSLIVTSVLDLLNAGSVSINWATGDKGVEDGPRERDYVYDTFGFYAQDDYRVARRLTVNLGLRYEPATVPTEKSGNDYEYHDLMTDTLTQATAGPLWQANTLKNFSPRVGLAWDLFGTGKTSVRAGYGLYYDLGDYGALFWAQTPGDLSPTGASDYAQVLGKITVPLNLTPTANNTFVTQTANDYHIKQPYLHQYNFGIQQQLLKGTVLSVSYVGSRGIHIYDVYDGNPVMPCNYPGANSVASTNGCAGLTSLPWNNGMTPVFNTNLLYVPLGPPGHLTTFCNPNYGSSCRLNPNLGETTLISSHGDSYYNSLQVSVTRQASRSLQFQGNWTYGRTTDTTQGTFQSDIESTSEVSDQWNRRFDFGPTGFDTKNNFRLNAMYQLPDLHASGFANALLNGWKVGNILSIQSGPPFDPINGIGVSETDAELQFMDGALKNCTERLSYVTAQNLAYAQSINPNAVLFNSKTVITHNPNQWFNPNMFTEPQVVTGTGGATGGVFGNVSRGKLYGPGSGDWDFSLIKDTRLPHLGEAAKLEFRAEFFNIINHTNFQFPSGETILSGNNAGMVTGAGGPGTYGINPQAGIVQNTSVNSRQIQFALKIIF